MELEKLTVRLAKGDKEILQQHFPQMGYQTALRQIVRKFCKKLQTKTEGTVKDATESLELG